MTKVWFCLRVGLNLNLPFSSVTVSPIFCLFGPKTSTGCCEGTLPLLK